MPDTVVNQPENVKISPYDETQLKGLETEILDEIHRGGCESGRTIWYLRKAFQLGFTAVNRGEAEGQVHPPKPAWMTSDEEQTGFTLGQEVCWTSQAGGCTRTKTGRVVEVVAAGKLPDRDRFPRLYTGSGVGLSRNEVSYVVSVSKGASRKPTLYWPHARGLKAFTSF